MSSIRLTAFCLAFSCRCRFACPAPRLGAVTLGITGLAATADPFLPLDLLLLAAVPTAAAAFLASFFLLSFFRIVRVIVDFSRGPYAAMKAACPLGFTSVDILILSSPVLPLDALIITGCC